jgi:hypothetical protein
MCCALFGRALLAVEWLAMKNKTIDKVNEWFEENRIICILGDERAQIKVIGKEIERFLERRKSLFDVINVNESSDSELTSMLSTTLKLFEVKYLTIIH